MIYPFVCDKCKEYEEVIRPVSECSFPHKCRCGSKMRRVWTRIYTSNTKHETYYNYGLGKEISNKFQLNDEIKKLNDKTGSDLIEVGNEEVKTKKKHNNYELSTKEMREVNSILGA